MLVFGTRPEAIKMCPLVKELKNRKSIQTLVCVTGQHKEMLQQVLDTFNVVPDYNLAIMKECQTLFDITTSILNKIKEVLEKEKPDIVLVHGDTSTSFVTALACFYLQIPVGHVEAGLRTYDKYSPFPEEMNRQMVDCMTDMYFAPTNLSKENLLKQNIDESKIFVTGNTAIDAMKTTVKKDYHNSVLDWIEAGNSAESRNFRGAKSDFSCNLHSAAAEFPIKPLLTAFFLSKKQNNCILRGQYIPEFAMSIRGKQGYNCCNTAISLYLLYKYW